MEFEEVKNAGAITPVPGGVGPLTITMVLNNTLLAEKMRKALNNLNSSVYYKKRHNFTLIMPLSFQ